MRLMKDGTNFALDTLDRRELLQTADIAIQKGKGDKKYLNLATKIVNDGKAKNGNLYVTLPMRRVLMGFIRPIFEEEYKKRARNTLKDGR